MRGFLALVFAAPISVQTCLSPKAGTGLLELTDLVLLIRLHRTSESTTGLLMPGDSQPV